MEHKETMKQITKRLRPGQDLRKGIEEMVTENGVKAGVLLSVVGSLQKAVLRMPQPSADVLKTKEWEESLEIVGGTGTLSQNGSHIHISISDQEGNVFGGHLKEGCVLRTGAEIVIGVFNDIEYKRAKDEETGYDELVI